MKLNWMDILLTNTTNNVYLLKCESYNSGCEETIVTIQTPISIQHLQMILATTHSLTLHVTSDASCHYKVGLCYLADQCS